jgi:hypothetical protein
MTFDFDSLERLLAEHNRMTSPYTGERRYVCDALVEAAPSLIALAKRAQEAEAVRDEFQEQAKRAGDKCERMERVVETSRACVDAWSNENLVRLYNALRDLDGGK